MKLIICRMFFLCLPISAVDESIALKLRARILRRHQSFLDVQNDRYPYLSKQLIDISFQCAEKRDQKACAALVKSVKDLVAKQTQDCAEILEQATVLLNAIQSSKQAHVGCIQQNHDAAVCEQLDAEKKTFFRRLLELGQAESICLGFRTGELSPLAQCETDSCAEFTRELYDRTVFLAHSRSPLLFHARMLDYAVREYREFMQQARKNCSA